MPSDRELLSMPSPEQVTLSEDPSIDEPNRHRIGLHLDDRSMGPDVIEQMLPANARTVNKFTPTPI